MSPVWDGFRRCGTQSSDYPPLPFPLVRGAQRAAVFLDTDKGSLFAPVGQVTAAGHRGSDPTNSIPRANGHAISASSSGGGGGDGDDGGDGGA